MYTDKELYDLLEACGYKTTEENLSTLKEGLESGKYEIFDAEEVFAEMVANDNYDEDYLCEFFDNHDLDEEDVDVIEEMFDMLDNDEDGTFLTESVFSRVARMGKGIGRGFKNLHTRIKDGSANRKATEQAQSKYHSDVDAAKSKYKKEMGAIKQGYNDTKGLNVAHAKEAWKAKTAAQKKTAKQEYKTAKDAWKQAKKKEITQNGSGKFTVAGDATEYATEKEAKAARKTAAKAAKDVAATKKLSASKRGFVKQAKTDFKKQRDAQITAAKAQLRTEKDAARSARMATPTKADGSRRYDLTSVSESYSDYELYQFLENSGYKTTSTNLEVLKEGLESGKYLIEFDLGYTDYELYQVLENSGYETSTENLDILKEGLLAGDYDIIVE